MSYRTIYDQIEELDPIPRGTAFEKLINKIFEDKEILINARYRTKDGSQEIDGAILIYNKVFLIETKWEDNKTLAASKLYSFLGKINSKIEGTLGIFISHEELKQNFIDSVRNGIRQNCILIHGKQNIADIIDKKVNIKDFIEYSFIQASTRNVISVNTSEFSTLPIQKNKKGLSSRQKTKIINNKWSGIYKSLTGDDSLSDFSAMLTTDYDSSLGLSKKILDIYNALKFNLNTKEKFNKLIEKLISEEKDEFVLQIAQKLKGNDWLSYADKDFCTLLEKYKLDFKLAEREAIINNVTSVIGNNEWEPENKATYVIGIFYEKLTKDEKDSLLIKFLEIYCDTSRNDWFPQKQFAQRLFVEYGRSEGYLPVIKDELIADLNAIKISEEMFLDEGFKKSELKKQTLRAFKRKYIKVFFENSQDIEAFFDEEYKKL